MGWNHWWLPNFPWTSGRRPLLLANHQMPFASRDASINLKVETNSRMTTILTYTNYMYIYAEIVTSDSFGFSVRDLTCHLRKSVVYRLLAVVVALVCVRN